MPFFGVFSGAGLRTEGPGGSRPNDTRGGLTRLVARIQKAGLLRREPDPEDGRGLYAVLTDESLEALRTSWPIYARGIAEYFGRHLADEEVEVLDRALCRISTAARGD